MKFMELQVSLPCFQETVHNPSPCLFRTCLDIWGLMVWLSIASRLVAGPTQPLFNISWGSSLQ